MPSEIAGPASGEDRLSALPDDALHIVLSFLPSEEVVRTCVLARRWRGLWKSAPTLRIARDGGRPWSVPWLHEFSRLLLLLRDSSPLDRCDIACSPFLPEDADDVFSFAEAWILRVLSLCKTRALAVRVSTAEDRLDFANAPFVSRHLTRMDLSDVALRSRSLDLSGCPALEDLELNSCSVCAERILSRSLQRLSMTSCDFRFIPRTRLYAPSLVSLKLVDSDGFAPLLGRMPSLVTAVVLLGDRCRDRCANNQYGHCGDDECCYGYSDDVQGSVLLQGLASAAHLELIALPEVFVFRKDLKWRPTFSNLKTLLLSESSAAADASVLVYFLRHSPVLEKLTLQLCKIPENVVECYNPGEERLASKRLEVVYIKYHQDGLLHKILKILCSYGVPPEKINLYPQSELMFS